MNKFLILAIVINFTAITFTQQQKKYFDAPFGGGIGYVPAWYIPNIDPVNVKLKSIGMPKLSTSGFYSSGGAGFIYLGFIKFLRIGGMGYGGSAATSQTVDGVNREVIYNLGGGGVTIEYTIPIIKDIALSVGATIGAGTLKIQMYKNSGNFTWAGSWEDFNSETNSSFSSTLENSYWIFSPTINLDFPLNRFILIRLGTGYQLAFNDNWTADNEKELKNVPSDLNANAFFVQSGIFIGFFSF
ncbi:MAG: hypothetical protein BMS9Abin39_0960 [Ignavibacteria bacterium]|nr:MAG: hypothetical protein BMS9Abin39_0960 [Ignavibacteria bacterium]